MSLVLDASVALAWIAKEENTAEIVSLFEELVSGMAWVPSLWWLEVANVLQMKVRRGRLQGRDRDEQLADLARLDLRTDAQTAQRAWNDTVVLSDRHNLTVYDASYLELALRRVLPLATLDQKLRVAAAAEGLPLLGR